MQNQKTPFTAQAKLPASLVAVALASLAWAPSAFAGSVGDRVVDMGALPTSSIRPISVMMKLQDQAGAEAYARATADPKNGSYRKFLSVNEFRARFGPSPASVQQTVAYLRSMGFRNVAPDANGMAVHAEASLARINQVFSTEVHEFSDASGKRFQAAKMPVTLPLELQRANALTVTGLNKLVQLTPKLKKMPASLGGVPLSLPAPAAAATGGVPGTATNVAGSYTVGDVAVRYNAAPLYKQNINGKHTTIGILTFANFYPADAYAYWSGIGLNVDQNRISQVHVDGGAGDPSAASGSGETSLDVEQAGGLAPNAKVIVYDAPNTDAGFIDVFNKAVSDNKADVLSLSWGMPEAYYFKSPITGNVDNTSQMKALHNVLIEAAIQGISVFTAAGDDGAYDTERSLPYPQFTKFLSVDYPASDPMITAAGGTTLPFKLTLKNGYQLNVPEERAWGWDYLSDYITANYGADAIYQTIFSSGGGGGVSSYWPMPIWQMLVSGTQRTPAGQVLAENKDGGMTLVTLRGGFLGRNVPDVSLNADPNTGYAVVSMADSPDTKGWITGYGGTSFVAPQLAGIAALLTQSSGGRIGLLTQQLYVMQALWGYGYGSPFNAVTSGDNWFYKSTKGYNPATGLGTLNVANLAKLVL